MDFDKVTERSSKYSDLEKKSVAELLQIINTEDQTVPLAISKALPQIEKVVEQIVASIQNGGRLFYIGAGTSGRLGIVDASECPPTFGVPFDLVNGIIAGGDQAIRRAVENAEDNTTQAWIDLQQEGAKSGDVVVGIAASGTTPYVIGGLKAAAKNGLVTACITCNAGSPLAVEAQYPIEVVVGPEVVTGSSRMKAGTAQKLVLNMLSTTSMIQLGRVRGNKMVDMQLSNDKLVDRGTKMIVEETGISYDEAKDLLLTKGSVRKAVDYNKENGRK